MAMDGLITLADLRAEVRTRADMPALNRPTNEQLDRLINLKAKRLYAMVALKDPSSFAKVSGNLDASSGSVDFGANLTDFWKLLRVDARVGDRWVPLRRFDLSEPESSVGTPFIWPYGPDAGQRYQLRGRSLYLTPSPPIYSTLRLLYVPRLADMVATTDTLDPFNGWGELVALEAAITLLQEEESDASGLMAERDRLRAQLESETDAQDQGEPYTVVDVRERDGW